MLFPVDYDSVKLKQSKSNCFLGAFVVVGDELGNTKTVSKVAESEQILKQ